MIKTITAACVVLGVLAGSASAAEYEYKLIGTDGPPTDAALNEAAKEGWRLKQIVPRPDAYYVYLERERGLPHVLNSSVSCLVKEPDGTRSIQFFESWPLAETFPDDWAVDCKGPEAMKASPDENTPSEGFPSKVSFGWNWYQQRWEQFEMAACIERYSDEHGLTDFLLQEALDACIAPAQTE